MGNLNFDKRFFILLLLVLLPLSLHAQVDHHHTPDSVHMHTHTHEGPLLETVIEWIGDFHRVSVHFPIALILMVALAELLHLRWPSPLFSYAARFMLMMAAIAVLPAVLLGLAHAYGHQYSGELVSTFWWHRFNGFSIALLAILAFVCKELHLRKKTLLTERCYFLCLIVLVPLVTITAHLGGELSDVL